MAQPIDKARAGTGTQVQNQATAGKGQDTDRAAFQAALETARPKPTAATAPGAPPSPPIVSGGAKAVVRDKQNVVEAGGKQVYAKIEGGANKGSATSYSVKQTEALLETRAGYTVQVDFEAGAASENPIVARVSDAAIALGVKSLTLEASIGVKDSRNVSETKSENGKPPTQKTTARETALDARLGIGLKTDAGDLGGDVAKVEWKPAKGAVEVSSGVKGSTDLTRYRPTTGSVGSGSDNEVTVAVAGARIRGAGLAALAPNSVDPAGAVDETKMRGEALVNVSQAGLDAVVSLPLAGAEAFLRSGQALAAGTEWVADGLQSGAGAVIPSLAPAAPRPDAPPRSSDFFKTTADAVGAANAGVREQAYDKLTWQLDAAQYAMVPDASGRTAQQRVAEAVTARFAPRIADLESRHGRIADADWNKERDSLAAEIEVAGFEIMRTIDGGEYARLADKIAPPAADAAPAPTLAAIPADQPTRIGQGAVSMPGLGKLEVTWDARTGVYAVEGANGVRHALPGIVDAAAARAKARDYLVYDAVSPKNRLPS